MFHVERHFFNSPNKARPARMIWVMSPAIMVPGSPLGSEYGTAAAAVAEAMGMTVVVSSGMSVGITLRGVGQFFCAGAGSFFLRPQNKKTPGGTGGHPLGISALGLLSSIALSSETARNMPRLGWRGKSFLRWPTGFFLTRRIRSCELRQRNACNFRSVKPSDSGVNGDR